MSLNVFGEVDKYEDWDIVNCPRVTHNTHMQISNDKIDATAQFIVEFKF